MSELWTTVTAGTAAGLGVAMPLGAIGVLLVQQAMRDRRGAVAAAVAVAGVDMAYAAVATALGPLVAAALSGMEAWVRLLSALVLAVIAVRGLSAAGRHALPITPGESGGPDGASGRDGCPGGRTVAGPAPAVSPSAPVSAAAPARVFARFAGLTLINPTTALYFAALTTARGENLSGGAAGTVFVAAVFAASLIWHQLLVAAGGFAGARISARARSWTFRIGFGLVAVHAVKVALPLPAL
ncbi:hypothetical protein [Streptomyces sp. CAU 1734]|uniref:hypothetical protein n=1 Tax=Streptomyces sp. CAU 1734 TaxID=3140360 RepID=UPI003260E0D5